jgi:hypothetical protein
MRLVKLFLIGTVVNSASCSSRSAGKLERWVLRGKRALDHVCSEPLLRIG